MSAWTSLAADLGIDHPLVLAPMAGGPSTPALAAAVSDAGGLGMLGAAYLAPEQIGAAVAEVRRLTDRPFGVNLFAGGATEGAADPEPMLRLLARWHEQMGIAPPELPPSPPDRFLEQLQALLEAEVRIVSFTFGIPDPAAIADLRDLGILVMATATTVEEAVNLEAAGVEAIVAQGSEAGGHRGTFLGSFEAGMIGTLSLIPQMVDAVGIPVVASGGIMDGRGIVAARALGAAGVQLGTAFLATDEAGTSPAYRARLLAARAEGTVVTRAFSGRPARGIRNAFVAEVEERGVPIPPFPLQNALTRPLRTAAAERQDPEALSLWAGQGIEMLRTGSAGALVRELLQEAARVVQLLRDEPLGPGGEEF